MPNRPPKNRISDKQLQQLKKEAVQQQHHHRCTTLVRNFDEFLLTKLFEEYYERKGIKKTALVEEWRNGVVTNAGTGRLNEDWARALDDTARALIEQFEKV